MSRSEYEEWRDAHCWDPSRGSELVIETDLAPAAWIGPLGDRTWCVCADTDWDYIYIAGSASCIDEILRACNR